MDVMQIELLGGPADGITLTVPADAKMWLVPTPMMTPAQLIALEEGGSSPESIGPIFDHVYVYSKSFSRRTMARFFHYSGPRPRPR